MKVVIFGNSGSGKSTLAAKLQAQYGLAHLDLDTVAWQPSTRPVRTPLDDSSADISQFIGRHTGWVIEGCYADLLEITLPYATEIIYLNLSVADCITNAKKRPWEPHKYESKQAQDNNLEMLIDWIAKYPLRDDMFSQSAHLNLYKRYEGLKRMQTTNL